MVTSVVIQGVVIQGTVVTRGIRAARTEVVQRP
jgi:hypothetical protein